MVYRTFDRVDKNIAIKTPSGKGALLGLMPGLEKEVRGAVKKAEGALKKEEGGKRDSSSKKGSSGKKGKGSGADKAKRAARELLK